jgi:hypothetical protein
VTLAADAQLTLVGRTTAWGTRLPVAPGRQGRGANNAGARPPLAVWLRGRGCGTIGAYLEAGGSLGGIVPARNQWIEVVGHIRPRLVHALPDDPRVASAPDCTLLLLEARMVRPAASQRQDQRPCLTAPQSVRLLPAYAAGPGSIATLAQWPDMVFWQRGGRPSAVSASWNTVRGVVTNLGRLRLLRYVLSFEPTLVPGAS